MRKAFAETLLNVASQNPDVIFLTGDLGFGVFDDFQEKFPERYINVGVAEAQLITASAGLALEGYRPIAYSIASFATARAYEQIRHCLAYSNLPVIVVGAGRGFTYGRDGVTHHAVDDIALMSGLPGMTVVIPGDPNEVKQLFPQLLNLKGPSYFTIGKYGDPGYEAEEPSVLAKARLLRKGEKIAIFSTGDLAVEALKAVDLLNDENIYPAAYQVHTVKPLDEETLTHVAREIKKFLIVEEHFPVGGLYSAIEMWNYANDCPVDLIRLRMPHEFALGNLSRKSVYKKYKLDNGSIAKTCKKAW